MDNTQVKKFETLVKSKEESNSINILKEIKQNLVTTGDKREKFKSVRHLKSGAVIVVCPR